MAKGTRGGKRGNTGLRASGKLDIGNETISFDGDLRYTDNDNRFSDVQRKAIEAWENKRVKNKIEYATAVDRSGKSLGEAKGGKGSVKTPIWWKQTTDNVFSHIHPREAGTLGGTFSDGDLRNWARSLIRTYRAVAKEGTYSISKQKGFDGRAFTSFFRVAHKNRETTMNNTMKQLNKDYSSGKIDYNSYSKSFDKVFNNFLVGLHNDLLDNQTKYNYKYHLEKR